MWTGIGKLAFLGLVVGWYGIRLPHLVRSHRTPIAICRRGGLERLLMAVSGVGMGFIPLAYLVFGFRGFADRPQGAVATVAGLVVEALALALFWASHAHLGRQWSVSLELRVEHRLQTEGLYAYVRHPMYAAFWAWCVAQALLLPNWIAGMSGLIGFGCLYLFRVPREERMMIEHYGDAYRAYAARTPRLFPIRLIAGSR